MKIPKEYRKGKVLPIMKVGEVVLLNKINNLEGKITSDYFMKYYWLLAVDMLVTSYHFDGAGLAAPQIGCCLPIFVLTVHPTPRYPDAPNFRDTVIVNPVVLWSSENKVTMAEGCLSIPGFYAGVTRPESIGVRYLSFNPISKKCALVERREFSGFVARVFQHEFDHLNGILFPQRVTDWTLCATEENRSLLREKIGKKV